MTETEIMAKTFFGLDLKTGGRVILWSHLFENIVIYVLSLTLMVSLRNLKLSEKSYLKSIVLFEDELENNAKLCRNIARSLG